MKDWIKELVVFEIYGYKQRKVGENLKENPNVLKESSDVSKTTPKRTKTSTRLRDFLIKRELLYPEKLAKIAASFDIEAKTEAERKFLEDIKFNDLLVVWDVYCKESRRIRPEFDQAEIDLIHQITTKLVADYGANPDLLRKFFQKTSDLRRAERICSFIVDLIQEIKKEFEKRFRAVATTYDDFVRYIDENKTKPAFISFLNFVTRVTFETEESLKSFIARMIPSLYKDLPSLQAFDLSTAADYFVRYLTEQGKVKIKKLQQKEGQEKEQTEEKIEEIDESVIKELEESLQKGVEVIQKEIATREESVREHLRGLLANVKSLVDEICSYPKIIEIHSHADQYLARLMDFLNTIEHLCNTTKIQEWCEFRKNLLSFLSPYIESRTLPSLTTLCKLLNGFYYYLNVLQTSLVSAPYSREAILEYLEKILTDPEINNDFVSSVFLLFMEKIGGKIKSSQDLERRIEEIFDRFFVKIMERIKVPEVKEQFKKNAFDIFQEIVLKKLEEFASTDLARHFPYHIRRELESALKLKNSNILDPQNEEEKLFLEKNGFFLLQKFLDELKDSTYRSEIKDVLIRLEEDLNQLPIKTIELERVIKLVGETWRNLSPNKLNTLVEEIKKHLEIVEEDFLYNFRREQVFPNQFSLPEGKDVQSLPGYSSPEGSSIWVEPQRKGDVEEVMNRL